MILCSVCAQANDDLQTICSSCGSYIQDRIPNIDFFATMWRLVESPKEAFHKITIAEHKNYVLFLMMFLGIATSFGLLWARHAGNEFNNLIYLILLGFVIGLGIALPIGLLLTVTVHWMLRLFGGKGTLKNTYGVLGWSLMPIMLSVSILLPIQLASIGLRLFSTNPSPMDVKPLVYIVLLGLDGFAALWTINLARVGFCVAHKISTWKSAGVSVLSALLFSIATYRLFAILVI
jgi:hypothetical protein